MENLYLENSSMNAISRQLQRFTLSEAFVVNFALYPMPNFADVFIRNKFDHLIEELETIPKFGMGSSGTVLWTRDFADVSSSFYSIEILNVQKYGRKKMIGHYYDTVETN